MIDDNDRQALIKYRMEQAFDAIDNVDFLINSDKLTIAVNRIYYGLFYSVTALAVNNGFETSKHSQLIGWFNKEFIATKKTDAIFGKILRNAFQNRTKGDYDAYVTFQKDEVSQMHVEMIDFINEIKRLISI
ncbi:MAG: HEPN domain-containing protein [Prolixibacteraceae bacterium]|nr:HEPN domain-containing protein [Prolixibacteraceae bacterium]